MRGKASQSLRRQPKARITPACAGKSALPDRWRGCRQDHPRMCGEKFSVRLDIQVLWGSPPHVRGKERVIERVPAACGITPACAGKRTIHARGNGYLQDHPRMCGEKCEVFAFDWLFVGSPPHVRGKVFGFSNPVSSFRITPACAGKSFRSGM